MHSTTLRGIFPEPKPIPRRDFIRENVRSIKHMQGILQDAGVIQPRKSKPTKPLQFQNIPRLIKSKEDLKKSSIDLTHLKLSISEEQNPQSFSTNLKLTNSGEKIIKPNDSKSITRQGKSHSKSKMKSKPLAKSKLTIKKTKKESEKPVECRFTDSCVQTERDEDLFKLYETGNIKYPSKCETQTKRTGNSPKKPKNDHGGQGDHDENPDSPINDIMDNFNILGISEEKDFIRENKNIKPKPVKQTLQKVLAQAPANYKKGEVPKYLKDRKDYFIEDFDDDCPEGHVVLPDEERKETLKVLRKSYAERIQELNMMPVRNDTLKMRKRKMEIEAELNRLDQGIKVFQRPKVFVKMDMFKVS